jgi:hypothetical protein
MYKVYLKNTFEAPPGGIFWKVNSPKEFIDSIHVEGSIAIQKLARYQSEKGR